LPSDGKCAVLETGRDVETEDRETSTPTADGRDNVVQLPRDWLGPREELVPLGPRAWNEEPAGEADKAYAAEDFWGERSDSLHGVVRSPQGEPDEAPVAPAPVEVPQRRLSRWSAPAALLLLVVVVAAVAIGRSLSSGGAAARPASSAVLLAGLTTTDQAVSADVAQVGRKHLAVARRRRPRPAVRHHLKPVHHAASSAEPASSGEGAQNTTVTQASTPTYVSPSQAASTGGGSSSGSSSSGSTGGGSSSSNRQPAFGASGTLGPGSSPNG
jgi:uncharacterized membrane protein YgcG